MAKGFTNPKALIDNTGGASAAISFDALPTVGRPLIVSVHQYRGSATLPVVTGITDNQGVAHSYVRLAQSQMVDGAGRQMVSLFLLPRVLVSAGTFTITVRKADLNCNIQIAELTGFVNLPELVQVGFETGGAAWAAIAAGAHRRFDALAIGAANVAATNNAAWSNSSSFTNIGNSPDGTANVVSSVDALDITAPGAPSLTYSRSVTTMTAWVGALAVLGEFEARAALAKKGRKRRAVVRHWWDVRGWWGPKAAIQRWFWRGWRVVAPSTSGGVGQHSVTLADVVTSATATLQVKAASNVTLADVTTAGSSKLFLQAAGSVQLGDVQASATATLHIKAQSAVTLGDVTSGGAGALRIAGVGGGQLADVATASAGVLQIKAASNVTLADVTSGGAGVLPIKGVGGGQLADVVAASTGALHIKAQSAVTLDAVTTSATGALAAGNAGQHSVTLTDVSTSASATLRIQAASNVTLADVTTSAPSKLFLQAAGSVQLGDVQTSATATLHIKAQCAVTLGDVVSVAVGTFEKPAFGPPSVARADPVTDRAGRPSTIEAIRSMASVPVRRAGSESARPRYTEGKRP